MEELSRIHAEHQETSSAPHAPSVTCGHRGEGEADDDTGEHTCGGQLVTAQMLPDVTQGHAEQPETEERNGGESGERAGATPDLCKPSLRRCARAVSVATRCLLWVLNVVLFSRGNKKSA